MDKKRLVLALLCLGLALIVLLTACGSGPTKTTTTTKPAGTTAPLPTMSGPAPEVTSIVADPAAVDLTGKATMQLRITAVYSNDYKDVVTNQSRYSTQNNKVATVNTLGEVAAVAAGTTNIEVTYTLGRVTKTLLVPVTVK